jgi:hypothetical protein
MKNARRRVNGQKIPIAKKRSRELETSASAITHRARSAPRGSHEKAACGQTKVAIVFETAPARGATARVWA